MIEIIETPKRYSTPPATTQPPDPVIPIPRPGYTFRRGSNNPLWEGGSYDLRINEIGGLNPNVTLSISEVYPSFIKDDKYTIAGAKNSDSLSLEDDMDINNWDLNRDASSSETEDLSANMLELSDDPVEFGFEIQDDKENEKKSEPNNKEQTTFDRFEDVTQKERNPNKVEHNERLDGVPVYLPDDEIPKVHLNDPNRSGPDYCTQCGGHYPWEEPLERGVNALRSGDARDGNPDYDHCNPNVTNVRSCECCGCPRCAAKSIRYRKTKQPSWACGNPNCGIEFDHPIRRPDNTDKRECLYWKCRHCGEPTQAPFPGIPENLL